MSITFPLSLPAKNYQSIEIAPRKVVAVSTSPFSLVQQTYEHPGERWEATLRLPPMRRADGEPWAAWLTSLRGPVGSFLLGDTVGYWPRGQSRYQPGTLLVDGDQSLGARALVFKTGGALVGAYFRAGDWLQLGSGSATRLHKVLADVSTDGSGKAAAEIWPALRGNVANNAPIVIVGARGKFMLATAPSWEIDSAGIYRGAALSCVEDLRS